MMSVITLTSENFEAEVMNSDKPVLIDFWATWCGPCQMVGPIVDEIAEEVTTIKVGKVNVDQAGELAKKFRVMSIPTLVLIENGEVKKTVVGAKQKEELLELFGL